MRHNAFGRKLGRTTAHRLSLFRNQLSALVAQERIVTTVAKAKELRPIAERAITHGKRGSVHARRLVGRWIQSRDLIKKLFDEIAPRFATRSGGYLRIVKLGSRQGDGAEMAVLEFVDFQLKKKEAAPSGADVKGKSVKKSEAAAEEASPKKAKGARPPAAKAPRKARGADKKAALKGEAKPKPGKAPAGPKRTSAPKKVGGS